ncbi:phosphate ABC transporter permease subunit PstC [Propionibacterium freudenreichii]|uniref:phosphate ABC transporter permease subunit PstC n=1 Tax=Propionibacterium freudenreichii TaxID=1744 RepID=UPI0005440A66|nr:phosphate ABC transporter permease subunit PstC [Propionibacterium freudenreichii]AJQ91608.1 Phosphate ABC transporter, permease protein PstC [Propionibacterium freudenreichii subsp. freudenreichii]MDK9333001.1 phosphate ABC transporter permease subunit PstC [Propionibacterium freudenreichii]MDK9341127.1 phosphate ABC transporter permease subunit PstC [Propionibacterium freudenreichii]MDK9349305.1 phosphate ABC transporter permease subunit PstC [Propionibacterium freudenreichii]MDK9350105.1
MSTTTSLRQAPGERPVPADELAALTTRGRRGGDTVFSGLSKGAGLVIVVILASVAIFLIWQALPAFTGKALPFGNTLKYVGPFLFGTVYSSVLALIFAVPLGIGIALFIAHYAPRQLASGLGYVIDLLAAVPSVVYGLWGINTLAKFMQPVHLWLTEHLSFIPLFSGRVSGTGRTMLTTAVVLAVMVLPIITAMCREVFLQVPKNQIEASLALGATRCEMVRQVVLPYSQSGIISAAMLALGRALGETMAVAMVLSGSRLVNFSIVTSQNSRTIAANIASTFPEANALELNQLIATGLLLFVITFAVNAISRWVIHRRADFSGANG